MCRCLVVDKGCKGGGELGGVHGVFSLVAHVMSVSQFGCMGVWVFV